ncbi:hypothetical protein LXL04_021376 [Taraxacum kok-saghyz]
MGSLDVKHQASARHTSSSGVYGTTRVVSHTQHIRFGWVEFGIELSVLGDSVVLRCFGNGSGEMSWRGMIFGLPFEAVGEERGEKKEENVAFPPVVRETPDDARSKKCALGAVFPPPRLRQLGSFENSYIPENPRTLPIFYISQIVIPFKKPTSVPSKTFIMIKIR